MKEELVRAMSVFETHPVLSVFKTHHSIIKLTVLLHWVPLNPKVICLVSKIRTCPVVENPLLMYLR